MLRANADVCFGGVGFEQHLEPPFDSGESLIEIEPSHVRLYINVVSKGPGELFGGDRLRRHRLERACKVSGVMGWKRVYLPCTWVLAVNVMACAGCSLSWAGNWYRREMSARVGLPTIRARICCTAKDENDAVLGKRGRTVEGPTRRLGYVSMRRLVTTRPRTMSPKCSYLPQPFRAGMCTAVDPTFHCPD